MDEQEKGEKMIPLSAVEPLLNRVAELVLHDPRPDSRLLLLYDSAARKLGRPSAGELIIS